MDTRFIPVKELEKAVAASISWSDAMRKVGKKPRGASLQFFKARVLKLRIDTSHFLGKAAHAGVYQTGRCKKKHWSERLVERKTKDRESNGKFRRAYIEYCKDNHVEIKCVDCNGDGNWFGKKLTLEINHKDNKNWNNTPSNLEWLCPNCHSVKTIY